MPNSRHLSFEQALIWLRDKGFDVSDRQLRRLREDRRIPFIRLGKRLYIREGALERYIAELHEVADREHRPKKGNTTD